MADDVFSAELTAYRVVFGFTTPDSVTDRASYVAWIDSQIPIVGADAGRRELLSAIKGRLLAAPPYVEDAPVVTP